MYRASKKRACGYGATGRRRVAGVAITLFLMPGGCVTPPASSRGHDLTGKSESTDLTGGAAESVLRLGQLVVLDEDLLGPGGEPCRAASEASEELRSLAGSWCQVLHQEPLSTEAGASLFLAVRVNAAPPAVGGGPALPVFLVGAFVFGVPVALDLRLDHETREAAAGALRRWGERALALGLDIGRSAFGLRIPVFEQAPTQHPSLSFAPTTATLAHYALLRWLSIREEAELEAWRAEDEHLHGEVVEWQAMEELTALGKALEESRDLFKNCYPLVTAALGQSPFALRDLRIAEPVEEVVCGPHTLTVYPGCIPIRVAACMEPSVYATPIVLAGPMFTFVGEEQLAASAAPENRFCICYENVSVDDQSSGALWFDLVKGGAPTFGDDEEDYRVRLTTSTRRTSEQADTVDPMPLAEPTPVLVPPLNGVMSGVASGSALAERPVDLAIEGVHTIFQDALLGATVLIQEDRPSMSQGAEYYSPPAQGQVHILTPRLHTGGQSKH